MKKCAFCESQSAVKDFCGCGHGATFGCSKRPACLDCETSHRRVFGPFFRALLATNAATRADSPRTRLLAILNETAAFYRREYRDGETVLASLRATSSFDRDAANFRLRISDVATRLPLNGGVAAHLVGKIKNAALVRAAEKLDDALRETCGAAYTQTDLIAELEARHQTVNRSR